MIPETRSIKSKSYAEVVGLPKTPEKQKSPNDGTLNSTPMRIARGGSSAEAVAVGALVARVTSPLVEPAAKAGGGARARSSSKPAPPAPSVVLISSDSSQSDGWQAPKRPRRSARHASNGGHDGTREPSPPSRSQKKKLAKARSSPSPPPREEVHEGAGPAQAKDAKRTAEADAAPAQLNPGSKPDQALASQAASAHAPQPMLPQMLPKAPELPAAGKAPAQAHSVLQLQRLAVRGVAPDGITLIEALFESLTNRALFCNWCFPAGLPESSYGMLRALLKAAKDLDPEVEFCLKHPFTPDQMFMATRFGAATSYLTAVRRAFKANKRVCSLEGDLFLAAVASLHFGVRVMVLGGATLQFPHPQLKYDFHPVDDVVAERSIALVMCPSGGGFNWLYPDTTILPDVAEDFSPQCAFVTAALPEPLLLDWTNDANTDRAVVGYSELAAAAEAASAGKATPRGQLSVGTAQLACQFPLQRMAVRGNLNPGLELCEALHQALSMRALISGWEYPDGLPANPSELRAALLRAASTLQPDEELSLMSPITPNEMFTGSHLNSLDDFLAEAKANGRFQRRSLRAELFMAAFASLFFGVRVIVLHEHADPAKKPVLTTYRDFQPSTKVVDERSIVLVLGQLSYFNWAHPAELELGEQPLCSPVCHTAVVELPAVIEDWADDTGTNMASLTSNVPSRPTAPRPRTMHTWYDGPRPGEEDLLAEDDIDMLAAEHPNASRVQIQFSLLSTKTASGRCNPVRASKALHALFDLDKPQMPTPTADVDTPGGGARGVMAMAASPANSGKHHSRNKAKRDRDEDTSNSDSDGTTPKHSGCGCCSTTAKRADDDDKRDPDTAGRQAPPAITLPQQSGTSAAPTSNQPSSSKQQADQPYSKRPLAEQLELVEEAVRAVVHLAACQPEQARRRIIYHLTFTEDVEEAAVCACKEFSNCPAALAPAPGVPTDGISFVERLLGRGVRPATIREMAARTEGGVGSELRPANLSRRWDDELAHDSLINLPHAERTRLAHRHLNSNLHTEAIKELEALNARSAAGLVTPQTRDSALQRHPNSAVRMAAEHEARVTARDRGAPVIVVSNNSTKLPQWKQGAEKDQKGFYWSSKQAIQQAWESNNRMEGEHAYRSFKSLVHHNMIAVLCFELNITLEEYEAMSDSQLLSSIDAVLKPKDSTEYFLKLSSLRVDAQGGQLTARYRAFSEPFIETLAEATASGMPVNAEQAKAVFKSACSSNNLLKLWLSEQKWKSVADMHQRIVRGLKQYETDSILRKLDSGGTSGQTQTELTGGTPASGGAGGGYQGRRQQQQNHQNQQQFQAGPPHPQQQQQRQQSIPWQQRPATQQQFQQPASINFAAAPVQQDQQQPAAASINFAAVPKHPGLDQRGENWHIPSAALGCRTNPCTGMFCQVCGAHNHTTDQCRRRAHKNANLSGYYSDNRPNMPRLQYDGPPQPQRPPQQQPQHQHQPQPQHQFAPPPAHYSGGAAAGGGAVNNFNRTAQRNYTPVQQQQQQQQPPPQQQHGSVNHAGQQGQQSPDNGGKPDQDRRQ